MGDEPAVEVQELVKLLVHQGHVATFNNLPKLSHHGEITDTCFPYGMA
jgi:hypothetical protein